MLTLLILKISASGKSPNHSFVRVVFPSKAFKSERSIKVLERGLEWDSHEARDKITLVLVIRPAGLIFELNQLSCQRLNPHKHITEQTHHSQ